ncbi:MAG: ABC transporter permease [Chloroflexi bacterium]|nr:ABC transporter permease [Chloroflexota bacterium]
MSSGALLREVVIRPVSGWRALGLGEVWEYRELVWYLALRDVKVRYKQTVLGGFWAVFHPLVTVIMFTMIFGRVAGIPSDGVPYAIFSMAGLLPWNFFVMGLTRSAQGLLSASGLISKVYFPRFVVPLASMFVAIIELAISSSVLIGLMFWYHQPLNVSVLLVLPLLVVASTASLGFGLLVSASTVRYRDLSHALPFLTQLWLYATPVIYPAGLMQSKLESVGLPGWVYGLNPMSGVVAGFRHALFGSGGLTPGLLVLSAVTAGVALVMGAFVFRRVESSVVDTI